MSLTVVSDYVTAARVLLQDQVQPYRYPDADLVQALNDGFLDMRRLRPDLFLFNSFAVPQFTSNDSTTVNVDGTYAHSLIYFMVGMAQARDEEWTQDSRAAGFLKMFRDQLTGLS